MNIDASEPANMIDMSVLTYANGTFEIIFKCPTTHQTVEFKGKITDPGLLSHLPVDSPVKLKSKSVKTPSSLEFVRRLTWRLLPPCVWTRVKILNGEEFDHSEAYILTNLMKSNKENVNDL